MKIDYLKNYLYKALRNACLNEIKLGEIHQTILSRIEKWLLLYIVAWTILCRICCAELSDLKRLEEKYAKKNIAFVSLSCTRNKKVWKKMVEDKYPAGNQLL